MCRNAEKGGQNYGCAATEAKAGFTIPIVARLSINTRRQRACLSPIPIQQQRIALLLVGLCIVGAKYPNLYGKYLFNDYCNGVFRALYTVNGKT